MVTDLHIYISQVATKERCLVIMKVYRVWIHLFNKVLYFSNKRTLGVCEKTPFLMGSQPSLVFFPFLDVDILASVHIHTFGKTK